MKKRNLKLRTKITLLIIIVEFISIATIASFIGRWSTINITREQELNIMDIAHMVANTPIIKDALSKKDPEGSIQEVVTIMMESTKRIEIIVVADMNSIRYGHPVPERIGEKFVGGDEVRVLTTGASYISEATGTLGRQIRAFAPVYDKHGTQVGFVMVGTMTENIRGEKLRSLLTIIFIAIGGLFLGILGAIILATNIKNTLLGLEPDEITKLYVEKKGILEAMHEGIIAINEQGKIALINDSAINILQLGETNVIDKNVLDVLPTSELIRVLNTGVAEYNRNQVINDTVIVTNRVPIMEGDKVIGAIATFRDKTMVTRLAEEITGVKQIIEALRANTHEFMNKLHVILGLIQMEEYDEAKKFILDETKKQQQILNLVMQKIKDPSIAGLILGKFSRAKELGINMRIDKKSFLHRLNGKINSNMMITIIGNLLENAMEATLKQDSGKKNIDLLVQELNSKIIIEVQDNGIGVNQKNAPQIFERGFTTKEGSRGVGLSLVYDIVQSMKGDISVESSIGEFTKLTVILPKEEMK